MSGMATHAEIVEWVEANVDAPTTYGAVAQALGTSARAVGGAMRNAPASLTKAHLVLRADWTINPGYRGPRGGGPEEAAAMLGRAGFAVVPVPPNTFRLATPPGPAPASR